MIVLVVDDDAFAIKLAKAVLEKEGANVIGVSTWPEVNAAFFDHEVALAFIDCQMPGLQGDQLVRILKQSPRGKKTPLILVSSLPEDDIRARAESSAADGWLQKPLTTSKVRTILRKHLPG